MLRFERVAKTYAGLIRRTPALREIDVRVEAGEVLGLVGANGAGKTTLIHLALGYLRPTAGWIRVFGVAPEDPAIRRRIGWVPDEPIYPRDATCRGLLDRWLAAHGLPRAERRNRINELLDEFGMAHAASRRIGTYSLGMQQKASLMLALSHRPDLLILDEPFSALDHRSLLGIRRSLAAFGGRGGGVLVSSHHLSELESLCTRVIFLKNGVVQRDERLDGSGATRVHVEIIAPGTARRALTEACPAFLSEWDIRDVTLVGRLDDRTRIPELIAFLVSRGVGIRGASEMTSRLEDAYMELERSP